jgi:ABC-type glycerol-3-phosphate transport system substrate-binding protein
MKTGALAALAAALLLAACGGDADDGSPTAAEAERLNRIAAETEAMDTSPDSLVAEDPALGNGETAETGDVLVADRNEGAANGQ